MIKCIDIKDAVQMCRNQLDIQRNIDRLKKTFITTNIDHFEGRALEIATFDDRKQPSIFS